MCGVNKKSTRTHSHKTQKVYSHGGRGKQVDTEAVEGRAWGGEDRQMMKVMKMKKKMTMRI
jgi:hypothetical protein